MMSKPLPILDQMPWNVKRAIVNSSDNKTKTELRRCSKELNEHVKDSKINLGPFLFRMHSNGRGGSLALNCKAVFGSDSTLGSYFVTEDRGATYTEIGEGNFISYSVEQLMKVFKNQAVHIECLMIDFDYDPSSDRQKQHALQFTKKLKEEMSKLSHQISVGMLLMFNDSNPDPILLILRHIKPSRQFSLALHPMDGGFLSSGAPFSKVNLSKIAETEQWKRANCVVLRRFTVPVDCPDTMCIPSMLFNVPVLSVKDVKFIVENITRRNGWRERTFTCQNVDESVMEYLGNFRVGQRGHGYDYEVPGVNGVPCYAHVLGRSKMKLWFHSYSEKPKSYY